MMTLRDPGCAALAPNGMVPSKRSVGPWPGDVYAGMLDGKHVFRRPPEIEPRDPGVRARWEANGRAW